MDILIIIYIHCYCYYNLINLKYIVSGVKTDE